MKTTIEKISEELTGDKNALKPGHIVEIKVEELAEIAERINKGGFSFVEVAGAAISSLISGLLWGYGLSDLAAFML